MLLKSTNFACANIEIDNSLKGEGLLNYIEKQILINIGESKHLLKQAESSKEISQSNYLRSHLFNLKGYIALLEAKYSDATEYFQQARILAIDSNNIFQQVQSYRREAVMMSALGQFSDAISLFNKSLLLSMGTNNKNDLSDIYMALANTYRTLKQNGKVLEYSKKLLAQAQQENKPLGVVAAYYFQSLVYIDLADFERARDLLDSLSFFTATIPTVQYLSSFSPLGNAKLALAEGRYSVALEQIDIALNIVENLNYPVGIPELLITKSEILYKDGQVQNALHLLQEIIELSESLNLNDYKLTALSKLSAIYESKGEFKQSLKYSKLYLEQKEASQVEIERQLLTVHQARIDLAGKERQIRELTFKQELNDQQRRNQLTLIAVGAVILILLGSFVVLLYKQKRQLKLTSIELISASKAKSEFLARMSHEIRTPINAIIGLTKLTLKNSSDKSQTTNLRHIEESSHTLLSVVNDILDFSKIDAGKLTIESANFDLDELINNCIRLHKLKAIEKGIEIIPFIHRDVPLNLTGDAFRLQQVLNNLLSNAIKFTETGSVSLIVKRLFTSPNVLLEFEVKDTGIGMDLLQFDNLFESFSQADESTTRLYGGSGLGLSICKQLVELMGGKIWVDSLLGQGSSFFFTIPFEVSKSEASHDRNKTDLTMLNVLVVEHQLLSAQFLADTLNRFGISSDIAASGRDGIAKFREALEADTPYDLILLSSHLSDINGIEVAAVMKQEKLTYDPKIILLYSGNPITLKNIGSSMGIDTYLSTPISVSSLFQAINEAIFNNIPKPSSANSNHQIIKLNNIRILLVEDNKINQKVALGFLEDTNADVRVVTNGKLALEALSTDPNFDLILMDIEMPVMDGLSATHLIRNHLNISIPIIAMTAHAMSDEVEKFLAAGMDAHVAKPINPSILYKTIGSLVNGPKHALNNMAIENTTTENMTREKSIKSANQSTGFSMADDLDRLCFINRTKALKAMMHNSHLYWEMVDEFTALNPHFNSLNEAIDDRKLETIGKLIHAIKPSLHYIGAFALADYVITLEKELKNAETSDSDDLLKQVKLALHAMEKISEKLKTSPR